MRILLVHPNKKESPPGLPLGLCQISAVLKEKGYHVKGIDLMIDSEKLFEKEIVKHDVLGLSVTTRTFTEAKRLAKKAKELNPKIIIVAGGPHPTLKPDEVMEDRNFDYCVVGEGEITMIVLLEYLKTPSFYPSHLIEIDGIWYRNKKVIIQNKPREFIKDISTLPHLDRELFDINKYGRKNWFATPIMASRSCPNNCSNCMPALKMIAGPYRRRSIEDIISEMKTLYNKYKVKYFFFQDNTISINREWFMELMKSIHSEFNDIKWSCTLTLNTVDSLVLNRMKQSGCFGFYAGVESGSQDVLDNILNKKLLLKHAKNIFCIADILELEYHLFFMIGIPGETKEQMLQTVEFAKQCNANSILFNIGKVIPCIGWEKTVNDNKWSLKYDVNNYDIPESMSLIQTDQWGPLFVDQVREKIKKDFNEINWRVDNDFLFNTPKHAQQQLLLSLLGECRRLALKPSLYNLRNLGIVLRNIF